MSTLESYANPRDGETQRQEGARSGIGAVVGAFAGLVAIVAFWIAFFFGVVQPWLDSCYM